MAAPSALATQSQPVRLPIIPQSPPRPIVSIAPVSTSNQPLHFVLTSVWAWPLGKSVSQAMRPSGAILGGFTFSGVYQAFKGSPLALTESANQD